MTAPPITSPSAPADPSAASPSVGVRQGWQLPGLAGRICRALGPDLLVEDLYSERGSRLYHELTAADTAEIGQLVRLLGDVTGPVLELACGSGRLALPLAAAGHDVTGVDSSAELLRILAGRLAEPTAARLRGTVALVEADVLALPLNRRYQAVVLGATSVRLFDGAQRRELFSAVHDLLLPGGRFVVSTARSTDEAGAGSADQGRHGPDIVVTTALADSVVTLIQHLLGDGRRRITAFHVPTGAPPRLFTSAVHPVPPDVLQAELIAAGLRVTATVSVPLPSHLGLGDDVLMVAEAPS